MYRQNGEGRQVFPVSADSQQQWGRKGKETRSFCYYLPGNGIESGRGRRAGASAFKAGADEAGKGQII